MLKKMLKFFLHPLALGTTPQGSIVYTLKAGVEQYVDWACMFCPKSLGFGWIS